VEKAAQAGPKSNNLMLDVIIALVLAALLGGYLALVYHLTYTGKKEKRGQMIYTLVLLSLGGSFVWLIVANNLVRAFGLAGALAMIRYRTRMQDPKDTTMVFFAIIIGMACGLHQYFTAIFGSAFVGLVLWIIKIINDRSELSQTRHHHGSHHLVDEGIHGDSGGDALPPAAPQPDKPAEDG
jgi:hypothetical protein